MKNVQIGYIFTNVSICSIFLLLYGLIVDVGWLVGWLVMMMMRNTRSLAGFDEELFISS